MIHPDDIDKAGRYDKITADFHPVEPAFLGRVASRIAVEPSHVATSDSVHCRLFFRGTKRFCG